MAPDEVDAFLAERRTQGTCCVGVSLAVLSFLPVSGP
ncbi:hypothetical protein EV190_10468 [Actinorugispora endophytica]|uniref:Uncharacterized protein n=1 Tax=Actinorugispora endophytica TaxID=1605990 RepID=A0A4V3D8V1_9ACTN|nr:hypothetical protein EV190_10468 [Actinorugispora endophytica]